ncbi:MAG: arginine deiminase family protein, partial [Solirubrobacteraceae bacterium]
MRDLASSFRDAPAPDRTASAPGVWSEVGELRRVLVHRPGPELTRLTPANKEALLFDDLPWVDRAQEEHDGFVALLRSRGV